LRIVAAYSALAGLCPLIPLPYVDDFLIRRVTRRMHSALYDAHGLFLSTSGERVLTEAPSVWLRGAATSVALFPVRRLLRKVVYLLAIRDCADVAAGVFHDGWLLARLLEQDNKGGKPGPSLEDTRYLQKVRKAMLRTYKEVDPAPFKRALLGAFLGARVGVEHAVSAIQRRRGGEAMPNVEDVEPVVDRMRAAAMSQWKYLDSLEQQFRRHLGLPAEQAGIEAQATAS
jgi:uncharacterized protein (DUF697 family)